MVTLVAENIFQDVEAEATLLNGEVVRRAFRSARGADWDRAFVKCCNYAELFDECRKAEKVAKSAQFRVLDPLTLQEKRNNIVWMIRQNRFAYAEECRQRRDELQTRLSLIWPCPKCVDKYSHTGKK